MEPTARELLDEMKPNNFGIIQSLIMATRVERVLALHSESTDFPGTCVACNYAKSPCLTLRLLNGEDN